MTSFGASKQIVEPGFMPTFKVQVQAYHGIGSMQPLPGEEPKFVQIYFMGDEGKQGNQQCSNIPGIQWKLSSPFKRCCINTIC